MKSCVKHLKRRQTKRAAKQLPFLSSQIFGAFYDVHRAQQQQCFNVLAANLILLSLNHFLNVAQLSLKWNSSRFLQTHRRTIFLSFLRYFPLFFWFLIYLNFQTVTVIIVLALIKNLDRNNTSNKHFLIWKIAYLIYEFSSLSLSVQSFISRDVVFITLETVSIILITLQFPAIRIPRV